MEIKEYLKQVKQLDLMIQDKLSEISQFKHLATSTTIAPKEVNVKSSGDKDRMGTIVAKIVDLEREADCLVDAFVDLKNEIYSAISMMTDTRHKYILVHKYIKYKNIYTIAQELNITDRWCKKEHKRALEEFEHMYDMKHP